MSSLSTYLLMQILVRNKIASSGSAWLPLLYDTVVLVLTFRRTFPSIRNEPGGSTLYIMKRVLEDGLIYYRQVNRLASIRYTDERPIVASSAIFAVTLVLTVMIAAAPAGLRNISAQ